MLRASALKSTAKAVAGDRVHNDTDVCLALWLIFYCADSSGGKEASAQIRRIRLADVFTCRSKG
jgi:hypothetical protein